MSRRYSDALAVFSRVLISHRVSKDSSSSFSEEQLHPKYEKIVSLALLATILCPSLHVDEQVKRAIAEKSDKVTLFLRVVLLQE